MGVASFIANRVAFSRQRQAGEKKSFSGFIIRLSIIATTISVAVMVVTLAFVNGFQYTVGQKVFSFLGHVRIQEKEQPKAIISEESPIEKNDSLAMAIRSNPYVKSIHPYSNKYALFKTREDMEGALLKGIDSTYDTAHIKPFIQQGRFIHFRPDGYSQEVMLSANTAAKLKMKAGDSLLVYFIRQGDMAGSKVNKVAIAGIFKTGITEYDDLFAIGDLKLIQWSKKELSTDDYSNEIGGYEIFLKDYHEIDTAATAIYNMDSFPAEWDAVSIRKISPNIFDWLNLMDSTRNMLIILMLAVAIINLVTCLIILVLERVKMTGVLKALGATDWTVQKIFLRHALLITSAGILLGLVFSLVLLWLQQATGFITLKEDAYYISQAAVKINWFQTGLVCLGTFVISVLVLLIPTFLIKRVQPVKAIQFR